MKLYTGRFCIIKVVAVDSSAKQARATTQSGNLVLVDVHGYREIRAGMDVPVFPDTFDDEWDVPEPKVGEGLVAVVYNCPDRSLYASMWDLKERFDQITAVILKKPGLRTVLPTSTGFLQRAV